MKKKIKIILLKDNPSLGKRYAILEVSSGYFRNFLLPNGLAKVATSDVIKDLEERKTRTEEEKKKRIAELENKADGLKGKVLTFKAKTTDGKKIFGSISVRDIEQELKSQGFSMASVNLKTPIKELGEYEVSVDLGEGVIVSVKVVVEEK